MTPDKFSSMKIFFFVCVFKFTVLFYLPVWAGSGQMSKSILRWPNLRFIGTKHFWYDFFFFLKIWDQAKK